MPGPSIELLLLVKAKREVARLEDEVRQQEALLQSTLHGGSDTAAADATLKLQSLRETLAAVEARKRLLAADVAQLKR